MESREKTFLEMLHHHAHQSKIILGFTLLILARVADIFSTFTSPGGFELGTFIGTGLNVAIVVMLISAVVTFSGASKTNSKTATLKALETGRHIATMAIVLLSISGGLMALGLLLFGLAGFFIGAIVGGLFALIIFLYYRPVIKMIASAKDNIETNTFYPLEAVSTFVIMTFVSIGLNVLLMLSSFLLPTEIQLPPAALLLTIASLIGSMAAHLIIVLAVKSFDKALRQISLEEFRNRQTSFLD